MTRAILVVEAILVVMFGAALFSYVRRLPPSVPLGMPLPVFLGSRVIGCAIIILLAHLGVLAFGGAVHAASWARRFALLAFAGGLLIAAIIGSGGLFLISFPQY